MPGSKTYIRTALVLVIIVIALAAGFVLGDARSATASSAAQRDRISQLTARVLLLQQRVDRIENGSVFYGPGSGIKHMVNSINDLQTKFGTICPFGGQLVSDVTTSFGRLSVNYVKCP